MTDRSDDAQTEPTMNTMLERIKALGNDLRDQIGGLRAHLSLIRNDVASMASDQTSFRAELASMVSDQTSVRNDLTSLRDEFHLFRGDLEIRLDRIEGRLIKRELKCSIFERTFASGVDN